MLAFHLRQLRGFAPEENLWPNAAVALVFGLPHQKSATFGAKKRGHPHCLFIISAFLFFFAPRVKKRARLLVQYLHEQYGCQMKAKILGGGSIRDEK